MLPSPFFFVQNLDNVVGRIARIPVHATTDRGTIRGALRQPAVPLQASLRLARGENIPKYVQ